MAAPGAKVYSRITIFIIPTIFVNILIHVKHRKYTLIYIPREGTHLLVYSSTYEIYIVNTFINLYANLLFVAVVRGYVLSNTDSEYATRSRKYDKAKLTLKAEDLP